MGATSIEWTDATWNPVTGCTKVSAGCKHCYAERVFPRAYAGKTVMAESPERFGDRVNLDKITRQRRFTDVMTHPDRLDQPLRWRKPRRVFVNSMSDLFHDDVPDDFIAQVFTVMARALQHTFQVLTKRPERMREWFADSAWERVCQSVITNKVLFKDGEDLDWPLPNVWLGVSVEDQATADQRIPLLLETPAAVRFVSYEPALGPVDFSAHGAHALPLSWTYSAGQGDHHPSGDGRGGWWSDLGHLPGEPPNVDWIIVGGESGPKARPFDVQWARDTIRQCRASGVACFVKQLGANPFDVEPLHYTDKRDADGGPIVDGGPFPIRLKHRAGGDMAEWPEDLRVRQTPHNYQED